MTHRVSRSAAALAAFSALCAPHAVHARRHVTSDPLPADQIQQLVADQDRLVARRDGEVLIFASDGSRLGRCGARAAPPPRAPRAWAGAPEAPELLRDAGLPDDDSTWLAEEVLEDEAARAPPRRAWSAEPARVPHALAASGASAWVATSDGVDRVRAHGCTRVALAGRDVSAISAGGATLAAIAGDELFEADLTAGGPTADPSFRAVAVLPPRPRLLAVDARGTVLVADDEGILAVDRQGGARRVLAVRTEALTGCGQTVAALAADGVYLWQGQGFRRAGLRPPGRVLACGDAPQRQWLAGGPGLWSSPDAVSWTEHGGWVGTTISAAAAVAGRVWVASEAGLAPVRLDDAVAWRPAVAGRAAPPPRQRPALPRLWCWPTITAALTVDWSWRSSAAYARRTTTAFVLFRFPLDRVSEAAGQLTALALERARRGADLARLELAADAGAAAPDPIDAGESTAWRELATDEREALR
ncbi:MAG TPA: hypothetical protein VN962_25455 [Polyangia bacterium]|nr:hypothetical protein [Polyangia bacterium]